MKAVADLITEFQINLSAHTANERPVVKIVLDARLFNTLCREMNELSIYKAQSSISYLSGKARFRGIEIESSKERELSANKESGE